MGWFYFLTISLTWSVSHSPHDERWCKSRTVQAANRSKRDTEAARGRTAVIQPCSAVATPRFCDPVVAFYAEKSYGVPAVKSGIGPRVLLLPLSHGAGFASVPVSRGSRYSRWRGLAGGGTGTYSMVSESREASKSEPAAMPSFLGVGPRMMPYFTYIACKRYRGKFARTGSMWKRGARLSPQDFICPPLVLESTCQPIAQQAIGRFRAGLLPPSTLDSLVSGLCLWGATCVRPRKGGSERSVRS